MKKRTITIFIIRHGEKPRVCKESNEKYSGLTLQGGIRAYHYLASDYIKNLIGNFPYDIYTYADYEQGIPSSRAYYTVKPLISTNSHMGNTYIANTDTDFNKIITDLKKSKNNKALVCWEHNNISKLIMAILRDEKMIGLTVPEYNDLIKDYKRIDLTAATTSTETYRIEGISKIFDSIFIDGTEIELGDAQDRDVQNIGYNRQPNTILSFCQDVEFSIMYELVVIQTQQDEFKFGSLKTYPNFVVDLERDSDGTYVSNVIEFMREYPYHEW